MTSLNRTSEAKNDKPRVLKMMYLTSLLVRPRTIPTQQYHSVGHPYGYCLPPPHPLCCWWRIPSVTVDLSGDVLVGILRRGLLPGHNTSHRPPYRRSYSQQYNNEFDPIRHRHYYHHQGRL